MKRIKLSLPVLVIVFLFSCSKQKTIKYEPIVKDIEVDTVKVVPDTIEVTEEAPPKLPDSPIFDEYAGYLPCADCPGISYKLTLKPDSTYSEEIAYTDLAEYEGKSEDSYFYTGNFTVKDDTVFLDKDEDAIKYLLIRRQGLQLLDTEKQLIEGDFSEKYILQKRSVELPILKSEPTADRRASLLRRKAQKGIDFFATGSEPDWLLDIDFDSLMSFHSLSSPAALQTPVPMPEQTEDLKIINYFAEAEDGILDVTISSEPCENTMSGEQFPYQVRVEAKDSTNTEFHTFEGCGRYVVDPNLENRWTLFSINGREILPDDFAQGRPFIMFELDLNRFSGNAGCNRIGGEIFVRGNEITFRQIISTKMICENIDFEQQFIKLLEGSTYTFELKNLVLTLENSDSELIELSAD